MRVLIATLACWLSATTSIAASEITTTDEVQTCTYTAKMVTPITKTGDTYISNRGPKFTRNQMVELVETIKSSQPIDKLNLESLGVTPETVAAHKDEILAACLRESTAVPLEIQAKNSSMLEYEEVCKIIPVCLEWGKVSTKRAKFSLTINDVTLSPEPIVVSSRHQFAYMLPWQVQIGAQKWNTYSTALPVKIAALCDKQGPCAPWLDGREYWRTAFWKDSKVWYSLVGWKFEEDATRQLCEKMPGYSDVARYLAIKTCAVGDVPVDRSSLNVRLTVLHPQKLSSVSWDSLLDKGKVGPTTVTWSKMLPAYAKSETLTSKHQWLVDWREAGEGRDVQANINGSRSYSDRDPEILMRVSPAWRAAKMLGTPELQVSFLRNGVWCGTAYFSSADSRALVTEISSDAAGSHWLDKQDVSWENPGYVIVQPDGKFEKHALKSK